MTWNGIRKSNNEAGTASCPTKCSDALIRLRPFQYWCFQTPHGDGGLFVFCFFAQPLLLGPTEWAGYIAVHVCVYGGAFSGWRSFPTTYLPTTLLLLLLRRQGSLLSWALLRKWVLRCTLVILVFPSDRVTHPPHRLAALPSVAVFFPPCLFSSSVVSMCGGAHPPEELGFLFFCRLFVFSIYHRNVSSSGKKNNNTIPARKRCAYCDGN